MKSSLETKLGMFVAVAVIAAVVLLELVGGTDLFRRGYKLHGLFITAQELKVGDPVKMAGVSIGKVEVIDFAEDKVRVTMKINEGRVVKTDAVATIRFAGLLGQNLVSITLGSAAAPKFEDDGTIHTAQQADLSAIMQKLENVAGGIENLTKSFSGDTIQNVLGPMTDFLKQNNPKLTTIFGNLESISDQVAKGQGTIGRLIADETLYISVTNAVLSLNKTASEVQLLFGDAKGFLTDAKSAVTNVESMFGDAKLAVADARKALGTASDTMAEARKTVDSINAGTGTLGRLVKDEELYRETTKAMATLREIIEKINRGQGSVGKLVNDESLFKNAKMTLQKLDKATEGLEDQGPLSILGIAINSLF